MPDEKGVLGLFPSLETVGGVQASGRVAWNGILAVDSPMFGERFLITHQSNGHVRGSGGSDGRSLEVSSRLGAVSTALARRWPVRLVLVWHLDLLRYLFVLRLSGARIVVFLHGIEAWKRQGVSTRLLLRRVDRFLCNSDHTWEQFLQMNPTLRDRAHRTIPLGIGEAVQQPPEHPSPTPIAVMISRLVRDENYKGHREVIDAWPMVLGRVPDAELWVVGEGDLRPDLEGLVRDRGLSHHVRFLGALPDAQKEQALVRSRCLLMPSRGEGFGLVYLEAMRLGRPCLVSTVDAGREVVNPPEAGLAADPSNACELADAISRLLGSGGEWDGWSCRARQRYETDFTAARFERRLVTALSEAIAENGSAA